MESLRGVTASGLAFGPDLLLTQQKSSPESEEYARKVRPKIGNAKGGCQTKEQRDSYEQIGGGYRVEEHGLSKESASRFS